MTNWQEMAEQLAAAEQRGIVKGMRAAAEIASGLATGKEGMFTEGVDEGIRRASSAILAAAEKEVAEGEVCEWGLNMPAHGAITRDIGCGGWTDKDPRHTFKFCPYCGKPIKVKGE